MVLWVVVSGGFALYVAHFGSYGKTYGTLAGVVVFLIWLWLSKHGAAAGRRADQGTPDRRSEPVEREPYVEPRDPPREDSLPE
ncbi:YhjD/YihY/BrkB family envelope integrity protein [Nonomuraea spiralis]|uniref:YhjD/YihY/BrkB family envelope integrity protein n=1 Tax=Nonomuraea spiralis TaxID=46182 RepID=A0ABV5IFA4_9ACTN|nr:YhjD/YihY/BrkB family envelope integrity protein [Nonomuraea spiralis]GGS71410.1 hypothetical protein GCM10010176_012910 [Nonomuraea spiralis]